MTALVWTLPALAWAAAPAGVAVAWVARRGLGRARPAAASAAAAVRGAAVALALLGAAGPVTTRTEPVSGFVAVAASGERAFEDADRTVRWNAPGEAGIAVESLRASLPSDRPAAIALAWSPGGAPSLDAAAALRPRGAATAVVAPPARLATVATATSPRVVLPAAAVEGVAFSWHVDAGDTPFDAGRATLSFDGVEEVVGVPAGARRVAASPVEARAGTHLVTARIAGRAPAVAFVRVAPAPAVLIVTTSGLEPPLAGRLRAQGLHVVVASDVTADLAPAADVVILASGAGARPAADMASRAAAGAGLLVLGGEGSRGLARFRGTALEDVLPVDLPEPPPPAPRTPEPSPPKPPPGPPDDAPRPAIDEADRQALRVALLLCIDRSGSMAGVKLTMAREAAIAAARTLSAEDRIGVVAFDEEWNWIVPFQSAQDLSALVRRVQRLRADGGTNFFPALREGFARIAEESCGIRHVILLTDGATKLAEFQPIVSAAAAQGITLSTVAVGDGADTDLLGRMAGWGQGRLYPAVDPERLPQVITLDTRRFVDAPREAARPRPPAEDVTAPTAETEPTPETAPPPREPPPPPPVAPRAPRLAAPAPFVAGLEAEPWPPLPHPETVRPRAAATAPFVWDDGGAALVVGRIGTGRCAVLAADAATREASDLWTWPVAGRALAQLVRFLAPTPPPADASPAVRGLILGDGRRAVAVEAQTDGVLRLTPQGGGAEVRVLCRADGDAAVGDLPADAPPGIWVGDWTPLDDVRPQPVGVVVPVPALPDDAARAAALAARSGAAVTDGLPSPPRAPDREHRDDRSAPLLAAAAVLLVAEAAFRRGARA